MTTGKLKPNFRDPVKELNLKIDSKLDAKLTAILEKVQSDTDAKAKVLAEKLQLEADAKAKALVEKLQLEADAKVEARVKTALQEREEREEKVAKTKADNIADAIATARAIAIGKDKTATVEQDSHEHKDGNSSDSISCPSCKTGHIHKVEGDKNGLVYRCHDGKCGFEAIMVRKDSDFKCSTCSAPIKKPENPDDLRNCPFCGNAKAFRFNWQKLWTVVDKK